MTKTMNIPTSSLKQAVKFMAESDDIDSPEFKATLQETADKMAAEGISDIGANRLLVTICASMLDAAPEIVVSMLAAVVYHNGYDYEIV